MERGLEGEAQCSVQDPAYGRIQNDTMIIPNSLWWSCNEWCLAKVCFLLMYDYAINTTIKPHN